MNFFNYTPPPWTVIDSPDFDKIYTTYSEYPIDGVFVMSVHVLVGNEYVLAYDNPLSTESQIKKTNLKYLSNWNTLATSINKQFPLDPEIGISENIFNTPEESWDKIDEMFSTKDDRLVDKEHPETPEYTMSVARKNKTKSKLMPNFEMSDNPHEIKQITQIRLSYLLELFKCLVNPHISVGFNVFDLTCNTLSTKARECKNVKFIRQLSRPALTFGGGIRGCNKTHRKRSQVKKTCKKRKN